LSTQSPQRRLIIHWATLKGLVAIIIFVAIAALTEFAIVLYAMNIGVKEKAGDLLQWTFSFPGTNRMITLSVSPLFNLVPAAVIITLLFSWVYLTRDIAIKPVATKKGKSGSVIETGKEAQVKKFFGRIKSGLLKVKGIAYVWQKIHFARATVKSALTILVVFATFILIISLFAYPELIYQTISSGYQDNPSLLGFVKGTEQAFAPVGRIFFILNLALVSAAPGFRDVVLGLSVIITPLTGLDNVGKYLAFQNIAAWISALVAMFYGDYIRKGYRYKGKRKS